MAGNSIKVLLIEDNPGDARLIREMLTEASGTTFQMQRAENLAAGLECLANGDFDVVLLDLSLPDSQGLDTFTKVNEQVPEMPIVVLTGRDDEELAVEALHKGAQDYVVKGQVNGQLLVRLIRYATERKSAEAEKEKMRGELFQAQKMEAIGTLAAGMAHDFNNLLSSIQGYSDLAMLKVDQEAPFYRDLKQIQEAAIRGSNLTRQLLLFSRRHPTEITPLDLNEVVDDVFNMLGRLIGEDIAINVSLEPDLWTMQGDRTSIEQVIVNLVVNAREAMPNGGQLTIATENVTLNQEQCTAIPEAQPGKHVSLSITDQGVGMDKDTIDHIFEPFFSTKEMGQGTGLGLYVVHGIVKYHGGWISVSSEPGQGSSFKVYFPALLEKAEVIADQTISPRGSLGRGHRILVVEDDEAVRQLITRILAENGYVVLEAGTAKEGLNIFKREKGQFDLVLSDVVLPDEDGLQLVTKLLAIKPALKVLLCSGYLDHRSRRQVIQAKGFPFLQKPFALPKLLETVEKVIRSAPKKAGEPLALSL